MNSHRHLLHPANLPILALSLLALHCVNKPMEPVAPKWDVDATAPLSVQEYTLAEIVEKDTSLFTVQSGGTLLMVKSSVHAAPTFVGDRISLDAINASFHSELGPFSVATSGITMNIQIPGFVPGQTVPIPPVASASVPAVNGDLPLIEWVDISSGSVQMTITNRMPVAMSILQPIALVNDLGATVASFDFTGSPLASGEVRNAVATLAGTHITKRVSLQGARVGTDGSHGAFVTIPTQMLEAQITPTNVTASAAAVTSVPAQHIEVLRTLPLNSQTLIRDVWLHQGTLSLQFANNLDLQLSFTLRLPELRTPAGQVFSTVVNLGPRGSSTVPINLSKYHIHASAGTFLRALTAECTVDASFAGGGSAVTINATDFVDVRATSNAIIADSAVAVLKPTVIAIDERVSLNLGSLSKKFRGSIVIPDADMRFVPQTSVDVPMELNLSFQAKGSDGKTVSLAVPVQKTSGQLSAIDFAPGDVGNFLSQITGALPESLRVVGSLTLNPDYDTTAPAAVGRNCSFSGDVDIALPMRLRIADGFFADTLVLGDTTADGSPDKRLDAKLVNSLRKTTVHIVVENGLPMGLTLKVDLLNRYRQGVLSLPQTAGDSIMIPAGVIVNGDVQSATVSQRSIELAGSEIDQFNVAEYVKLALGVTTPGSSAVNFRTTDKVRIRVWTSIAYRVNS